MEGGRENRGRWKRREEGFKRKAKSEGKTKGMGRVGIERWKEEKKSHFLGKVFLDFLVLWR